MLELCFFFGLKGLVSVIMASTPLKYQHYLMAYDHLNTYKVCHYSNSQLPNLQMLWVSKLMIFVFNEKSIISIIEITLFDFLYSIYRKVGFVI